ncbi:hypothetical protein [Streptomyces sp. NPDC002044]|uniref:hypothetical protein n=1 Tax=Streptomyces sp. NPDC002044 TaxID=3154662 RepID=UPI00332AF4F0
MPSSSREFQMSAKVRPVRANFPRCSSYSASWVRSRDSFADCEFSRLLGWIRESHVGSPRVARSFEMERRLSPSKIFFAISWASSM